MELVFLQGSKLMGSLMNGLCVYATIAAGALLALSIWTWRRYDVSPSRQIEIAFFSGGLMLWLGTMIGLFGSFQVPVRLLAEQNGKFTPPANPSNKGTFSEKLFDAPQPSGPSSHMRFRKAAFLATQEARWPAMIDGPPFMTSQRIPSTCPMERDWKLTRAWATG